MLRSLNLLLQDILQSHGISSELADTFSQLLHRHCVLVEVKSEGRLVVDVGLSLNVLGFGARCIKLLWNSFAGVHQLFKEVWLRWVSICFHMELISRTEIVK